MQAWERYSSSILKPILKLPRFFAAQVAQDAEDVPEETGEESWVSAGRDDKPDLDAKNSPQTHDDKGYALRPSRIRKGANDTPSLMTVASAVNISASRLNLPGSLLRNPTGNRARSSRDETALKRSAGLPMQNRANQESKQRHEQEEPKMTRDVQSLKPPSYMSPPLEKNPLGEEKKVIRQRVFANNQFGGSRSAAITTSTFARLAQEQRIYQSPLQIYHPAFSYPALPAMTRQLTGAKQGTTNTREVSMLAKEEPANGIEDEGCNTGVYNSKVTAPVSISMNRPLLETLIVQNNSATNADEIRQRVEDVLLEIINSAVSKL